MDKDTIKELLDRFMDGKTTIAEERQLADWFRTAIVPEEWIAYKDMFAYFDAGMPADEPQQTVEPEGTAVRRKALLWWAAAVAVVALLCSVAVWTTRTSAPEKPIAQTVVKSFKKPSAVIAPADTATHEAEARPDTTAAPDKSQKKRPSMKHRYEPAPPKVYLAEAAPIANPADSIDAAATQLAEAKLREVEQRQQAYLKAIAIKDYINALDIAAVTDDEEEIY